MTRYPRLEWPVAAEHDAQERGNDYLRSAATLLKQMAAEVEPLAKVNTELATAVEAVRCGVAALIPIVEFIPTVSENSPCLDELTRLAKRRIARLAAELEQITYYAESLMLHLPVGNQPIS